MRRRGYQRSSRGGSGRLRLVAGAAGGRRITFPAVAGLRPTPERTRETLFNWLRDRVAGSRVLDLFAGSGALAFEALSRGAVAAVLVERDRSALAALRRNAALLDVPAEVMGAEVSAWLRRARSRAPFDLVFLDPPFASGAAAGTLELLAERADLLAADVRVYCEWPAAEPEPWRVERWTPLRETRSGDSRGVLLASAEPARAR